MKFNIFFVVIVMAAFAACKPTYKATDKPRSTTDSTSGTAFIPDSTKMPAAPDPAKIPAAPDSTKMPAAPDSTKMPVAPDPVKIPAAPDSTKIPAPPDPAKIPAAPDSTKMPAAPDPVKIPAAPDSTKAPVAPDPTKIPAAPDSAKIPAAPDQAKIATAPDSSKMPATDKTPSTSVSVPEGTQTAFTTQYPGAANVVWTSFDSLEVVPIDLKMAGLTALDAKDYQVRFDLKEQNYYAWYDSDGKWVGSAYKLEDHTKLPAAVKTTVKTKYPGYSITNVNRLFQKARKPYEIELKKDEDDTKMKLLVNADGKTIKVIKYVKAKTK